MKNRFIIAIMITVLLTSQSASMADTSESDTIDMPVVSLYVDGSYTPDLDTLYNYFGVPYFILHSDNPEYNVEITDTEMISAGLRSVYYDTYLQQWRVSFTTKADAPLIWNSDMDDDDTSKIKIHATEDDLKTPTSDFGTTEEDLGLPFFYGSLSYQLKNETEDSGSSWEYTTDFLVDSYNILFLDQIGDYNSNNLTVTVSYVENLSYVNLNSTYAYNVTLLNEPVNGYDEFWWRLDLENTNTTHDEYVANIKIENFDVKGGRYVVDTDTDTEDQRYQDNFIGGLSDIETVGLNARASDYFATKISPADIRTSSVPGPEGLRLSSWIDDVTPSQVLGVPSRFDENANDMRTEIRGWRDKKALENSIKQSIIDKSQTDSIKIFDNINDLRLTSAILSYKIPAKAIDMIEKSIQQASDKVDNIEDLVADVSSKTYKRIMIITDDISNELTLNGFFSDLGSGISSVIDSTAGGVSTILGGAASFGSDIIGSIAGGSSQVIATTGGTISSGGATLIGATSQGLKDVGFNLQPIIWGAVIIAGIIAIMYARTYMEAMSNN